MTAKQFEYCCHLARSEADLSAVDDFMLDGLATPEFPVPTFAPAEAVAKAIRWHARYLNGKWDAEAIEEMRFWLRRRVQLTSGSEGRAEDFLAAVAMLKATA